MIDAGATVRELENNTPSARNMINRLLENAQPTSLIAVEIQSETVDSLKLVPDMNAGKRLKSTLKEVLELRKILAEAENDVKARNKYNETVKNIGVQIKALPISFSHRLLAIFGLVRPYFRLNDF